MSHTDAEPGAPTLPQIAEIRQHGALRAVALLEERHGRLLSVDAAGREARLVPSRVVWWTGVAAPRDAAAAREALAVHEARAEAAARALDPGELWSRARELGHRLAVARLAELAPDPDDPLAVPAVLRAMIADGLRFRLRAGQIEVLSGAEIAAVEEARREARRRRRAREETVAWLRGASPAAPAGSEDLVESLVRLAAEPGQPSTRDAGMLLLREAGLEASPRSAFDVLVRLGVLSPDENLLLIQHGLGGPFPTAALEEAHRALERGPSGGIFRDLTHLDAVSIDDPGTTEVDDALSVQLGPRGSAVVWVHLALPGAWIEPGGALDEEAARRQLTLYLPAGHHPMLPPRLARGGVSLDEGQARPALSVRIQVDAAGGEVRAEPVLTRVRVSRAVSYERAEELLAAASPGDDLAVLARLADAHRRLRLDAGAVETALPEVVPRPGRGGRVELDALDGGATARRTVAEWAVWANHAVARWCVAGAIPMPYRTQELRAPVPEGVDPGDPYDVYRLTTSLDRTVISVDPGPHRGLGLDVYSQVTSPLRRYLDLVGQRQVAAALEGAAPPLDRDAMVRVLSRAEAGISRARAVMTGTRERALMRWVEHHADEPLEAVVLRQRRRRARLLLLRPGLRVSLTPRRRLEPGERLAVRAVEVDPVRGHLVVEEVEA